jgi:hypothetical protein
MGNTGGTIKFHRHEITMTTRQMIPVADGKGGMQTPNAQCRFPRHPHLGITILKNMWNSAGRLCHLTPKE